MSFIQQTRTAECGRSIPFTAYKTSACACVRSCIVLNSLSAYSSLLGVILSIGLAVCQRILNTLVGLLSVRDRERLLAKHYITTRNGRQMAPGENSCVQKMKLRAEYCAVGVFCTVREWGNICTGGRLWVGLQRDEWRGSDLRGWFVDR